MRTGRSLRCAGGEARRIRAGDTLFFPANTTGAWHITETLRKVYVVMG